MLPSITHNAKGSSPFKGFLDISIVTQKLRKQMHSQEGSSRKQNNFEFATGAVPNGNEVSVQEAVRGTRFKHLDKQVQMSPKVLETWINETLSDAEHLDIPGVILKPEHKNPISRYGIDRMVLSNAGIPNELIDRVYRALFVYSVGFYELIKRCL